MHNEIPSREQSKAPPFLSLSAALGASVHYRPGSCHDRVINPTSDASKSVYSPGPQTQPAPRERVEQVFASGTLQTGRHINKQQKNYSHPQGRQHALKRHEPHPTLHPNINDKVLLVQATLQWQIIGVKQSGSLTTGDIPFGLRQWQLAGGHEHGARRACGATA